MVHFLQNLEKMDKNAPVVGEGYECVVKDCGNWKTNHIHNLSFWLILSAHCKNT